MKNGGMQQLIATNSEEKLAAAELKKIDDVMLTFRSQIRSGMIITNKILKENIKTLSN